MSLAGVYVHIPFCKTKCPYCDFYSVVSNENLQEQYKNAVINDILNTQKYKDVNTLYFGGGTPILMDENYIKSIIDTVKEKFNLKGEITLEANPCITTYEKLKRLYDAGVNRISFGMQSASEEELKILGRKHLNEEVCNAVKNAKKAGFENISVDIMLATPRQTINSIKKTLDFVLSLDIEHISAYMLKIEKGTKFDCDEIFNSLPDEDEVSDIYLFVCEYLEKNGFYQYEISNFCKKGYESKHNLKYWNLDEYYAFGASAHGYVNGKRYFYPRDLKEYIDTNGENKIYENSQDINLLEEYIMLKLRLVDGVDLKQLQKKFSVDIEKIKNSVKKFIENDLMTLNYDRLSITKKGFLLSNYIISDILMCI